MANTTSIRLYLAEGGNQYFALFFFTSHIKGFHAMMEAKWDLDEEQGRGFSYTPPMGGLFGTSQKTADTNPLAKLLEKFLSEERTSGEIYEFTLLQGYLPKHANDILRSFEDGERLTFNTLEGKKKRKGAFYLTYKNYREEQQGKIILTTKLKH